MLSVVIVTYNTDRLLWECLSSLASHQAARRYEVVVINNGDALALQDFRTRAFPSESSTIPATSVTARLSTRARG